MPRVNPSITGQGMYDTTRPSRSTPATVTRMPARMPTTTTASVPWRATSGTRTTVIAPVGPDTWTLEPPKTAATSPATIAVVSPAAAPSPVVMPKARARGSATTPTVRPATRSAFQVREKSL